AKQWWQEFLEIRPSHQSKLVKIFAQDENGVNRPVCSYVRVLRAGRLLESPRQAARFVCLLAQQRAPVVGGGVRQEQWCSMMGFLCRNKGDCEDHAPLLCSLLLGFGLDAYVCLCMWAQKPKHSIHLGHDQPSCFIFCTRYLHRPIDPDAPHIVPQPKPTHPYRTLGCVFNHKMFLVNCQQSDAVELCVFDFTDGSCWKAMSEEAVRSVCAPGSSSSLPTTPPLCSPSVVPNEASRLKFLTEIVCPRGDHVRLAVRVRVFAYPESACAVWIMFACKYRSVL
uniref:Centrosomal protein 76 n=1 Tax=Cyprinus carpio TaxID=7962 RepID=A0A8C2J7L7_CYPCA